MASNAKRTTKTRSPAPCAAPAEPLEVSAKEAHDTCDTSGTPDHATLFEACDGLQAALVQAVYLHRFMGEIGGAVATDGDKSALRAYGYALSTITHIEQTISAAILKIQWTDMEAYRAHSAKAEARHG